MSRFKTEEARRLHNRRKHEKRKQRRLTDPEYRARENARKKQWLKARKAADPIFRKQLSRRKALQALYGISIEDYDVLMESQDGKCGICSLEPAVGQKRLAVDHDHETDYIRGLLCMGCNTGIGKFKHDVRLLQRAIEWLS